MDWKYGATSDCRNWTRFFDNLLSIALLSIIIFHCFNSWLSCFSSRFDFSSSYNFLWIFLKTSIGISMYLVSMPYTLMRRVLIGGAGAGMMLGISYARWWDRKNNKALESKSVLHFGCFVVSRILWSSVMYHVSCITYHVSSVIIPSFTVYCLFPCFVVPSREMFIKVLILCYDICNYFQHVLSWF